MQCKKKKINYFYVFLLSVILVYGLLQSSILSFNSYASSTYTVDDYLTQNDFYEVASYIARGLASFPDATGGGTGFTYQAFADYLEEKGKSDVLQQTVAVIENEASGGRGYDLPQEARQEIINFVNETVIEADPLSYVACYIQSYNFLDPTSVSTYNMYVSLKQYIKQQKGKWVLVAPRFVNNGVATEVIIYTIDLNQDVGLVGTVNNGIFSSVTAYINWQYIGSTLSVYRMTENGQLIGPTNFNAPYTFSNGNSVNSTNPYKWTMFSPNEKNELVYVFNTLNAYKNYNSGMPQPYYLATDPSIIAPSTDIITSGDLGRSGNFYNSIVNNVSSGDNPGKIQTVVDDVLKGQVSSGDTTDNDFNLDFLGTLGKVISAVTGAFTPVSELINNQLSEFLTDTFGWLPPEIVTLWISGIIFAVLFGILKIIRG